MLVITRNVNEAGKSGVVLKVPGYPDVRISVESVKGDRVRLGIEADERIGIMRDELIEAPAPAPSPE